MKEVNIYKTDIEQFLGIVIMSIVNMPNLRSYWSGNTYSHIIRNYMSVNLFKNIKICIHFNNNEFDLPRDDPNRDRLYKLKPIISALKQKYIGIPMEECISLDE